MYLVPSSPCRRPAPAHRSAPEQGLTRGEYGQLHCWLGSDFTSFLTSPTPAPGPTKDPTALCLLVTFTLLKVRGLSSVSQLECLLFYHDSVEVTYLWQENCRSAVRFLACLVGRRKPECFDLIPLGKVVSARFPH